MIKSASPLDVTATVSRLEDAFRERGVTLFGKIDHEQAAMGAGLALPPTVVLLVGNPTVGTRLMQADRNIALDLPLRLLIWSDAGGTWISYEDPDALVRRYNVTGMDDVVTKMRNMLAAAVGAAVT